MEKGPQDSVSRNLDKYIVRLPPGMRERIAAAAKASGRSMNAEIVAGVEQSLQTGSDAKSLTTGALIEELVTRLGARISIIVAPEAAAAAGISSTD